ncbi:MAG: sigma-54-dependent transcriptional regulator [Puniceicoccaceae bacterium]
MLGIDKILILDDELIIRRTLQEYCHRKRIKVKTVATIAEAMNALEGDHGFDLMILDVNLPDGDGSEILEAVEGAPDTPMSIMITGQGTIESAVRCMQLGAFDYILKPFSTDQVDMILQRAAKYDRLVKVNRELSHDQSESEHPLIGESESMLKLKDLIGCVARTDATVMINGETGTGKELIAQSIHQNSHRRDKPFIKVNCAAVSESLIESEFFGHEKGAFTGATQSRIGRFELADGGTLLLDEISEISLPLQAKLLRVLQEKELERVGGNKTIKVDVRIIATTNRDLPKSIDAGEFRQDLYYRLNVFPLISPSLSERKSDIPLLARHFLTQFSRKHGRNLKDFTKQAYTLLERHSWPGNVRELQNAIERAVILTPGGEQVSASALPLDIQVLGEEEIASLGLSPVPFNLPAESVASRSQGGNGVSGVIEEGMSSDDWTLESMERRLVLQSLKQTDGNRTKAAEMMGISIRTLFNKLNQYKKKGFSDFDEYLNS